MFLSMHSEVVFSQFDKLSIISTLKQQKKIPFDMYIIVMTMDLKMIHLAADFINFIIHLPTSLHKSYERIVISQLLSFYNNTQWGKKQRLGQCKLWL